MQNKVESHFRCIFPKTLFILSSTLKINFTELPLVPLPTTISKNAIEIF